MAIHTIDVVPLPIIFAAWKFCENFTYEDNFNNTFALYYGDAGAKLINTILYAKFIIKKY